jgi:hypothetical protein
MSTKSVSLLIFALVVLPETGNSDGEVGNCDA